MHRTVSGIYPSKWLRADDLRGGSTVVTIEKTEVDTIRQRNGAHEQKIVLSFFGKTKRLILNKTQAFATAEATGTEVFDDWKGHHIRLSAGVAPNRRPTIVVSKPGSELNGKGKIAAFYSTEAEDNPFEDDDDDDVPY